MSSETEEMQLQAVFRNLGAGERQANVMARQTLKRANQIAAERGVSRAEALRGLLEVVVAGRSGEVPESLKPRNDGDCGADEAR